MPKKTHEAYSLFKKLTPSGRVWYVKFWDGLSRRYSSVKSTGIPVEGKQERKEAEEKATDMLRNSHLPPDPIKQIAKLREENNLLRAELDYAWKTAGQKEEVLF